MAISGGFFQYEMVKSVKVNVKARCPPLELYKGLTPRANTAEPETITTATTTKKVSPSRRRHSSVLGTLRWKSSHFFCSAASCACRRSATAREPCGAVSIVDTSHQIVDTSNPIVDTKWVVCNKGDADTTDCGARRVS